MCLSFGNPFANAWGKAFLRHLKTELNRSFPNSGQEILERTRLTAQTLYDSRSQTLPDRQAGTILGMCSLVLAAYRESKVTLGNQQAALDVVKAALHQNYKGFGKFMNRPLLWISRDPVTLLSKLNLKRWSQWMYGKSMEFEQETAADRVTLLVNRCAFHQFFVEQGEPELTRLFCAWDRHWMDVIDESKRPMRTERPSTISTGAGSCRFHFVRDVQKEGKPKIDVILETAITNNRLSSGEETD